MIDDLPTNEKGPAITPPDEKPIRLKVTPYGVKLAFFHSTKSIRPMKVAIPLEQWRLMNQLVEIRARIALIGFTPETLALHEIDAVEVPLPPAPQPFPDHTQEDEK